MEIHNVRQAVETKRSYSIVSYKAPRKTHPSPCFSVSLFRFVESSKVDQCLLFLLRHESPSRFCICKHQPSANYVGPQLIVRPVLLGLSNTLRSFLHRGPDETHIFWLSQDLPSRTTDYIRTNEVTTVVGHERRKSSAGMLLSLISSMTMDKFIRPDGVILEKNASDDQLSMV